MLLINFIFKVFKIMKILIKRYKEFNNFLKFAFWFCSLVFFAVSLFFILNDKSWHIPTENEIHYSTGKAYAITQNYYQKNNGYGNVAHIELHTNNGDKLYFTCSYTALNYTQYSGCDREKINDFKKKVHNKQVEIGWYKQKPFFGITNPYPQMISLTIKDNYGIFHYRTKESSLNQMLGYHKVTLFFIIFAFFLLYGIMFRTIYRVYYPKGVKDSVST